MKSKQILPLLLLACASGAVHAEQRRDARDGVAVQAVVATREATRIRIEGARIVDVVGNIYANTCQSAAAQAAPGVPGAPPPSPVVAPNGEFILNCDATKGEIYIKPVGKSSKPINLFVSSPKATYTLILRRSDVPADTIVLVDRSQAARPAAEERLTPSSERIKALKTMLLALSTERLPADARLEEVNREHRLWAATALTLERVISWNGWTGERYLLTNTGTLPMPLAEQEFDREGEQVAAVALDSHELAPGASSHVYVIRRGD
ncbi:type-F conjugative transfer system secretin TraK [Massilia sp. TS11]|uniref:type-F conjugative transfer system secretin TraK n=1 Tax=Massilia sp. TS11 TaxID=2908003 RepID=UPI001EDB87BF|nr:type-F conjugative transfer system secretin TraK [Massilia sp. TS11]MCG2583891.1 type-F conjugative transfer system secretin TraK [Massilia sp. TS11]